MSRSIRCSDEVYRQVTTIAGEKLLSLTDALDYITGTRLERFTTAQPAAQEETEKVSDNQSERNIIFVIDPEDTKDDRPPDQFVFTKD